jgi:hypothetical protein
MDGNSYVTCKAVLMVRIANELIEQTCPKSITFAFRLYYRLTVSYYLSNNSRAMHSSGIFDT